MIVIIKGEFVFYQPWSPLIGNILLSPQSNAKKDCGLATNCLSTHSSCTLIDQILTKEQGIMDAITLSILNEKLIGLITEHTCEVFPYNILYVGTRLITVNIIDTDISLWGGN